MNRKYVYELLYLPICLCIRAMFVLQWTFLNQIFFVCHKSLKQIFKTGFKYKITL